MRHHANISKQGVGIVLQMLASYMQLLGLLRLVSINWDERLSNVLVYLDFTSGSSTWMSLECSLRGVNNIPASILRSVVVLLFPCTCGLDSGHALPPPRSIYRYACQAAVPSVLGIAQQFEYLGLAKLAFTCTDFLCLQ